MKSLSSWLLAGALAASLTWNWTRERDAAARAAAGCAIAGSCDPAAAAVELEEAERTALLAVCERSCGESDRLEREADSLQRRLLASLSADEVDREETLRLVTEVSELRRRSLASCVEGILGVREVLSAEEVRALLASCERSGAEATCR